MTASQQLEVIGRLALLVHELRDRGMSGSDADRDAETAAQDKLHDACELYLREQGEQAALRELEGLKPAPAQRICGWCRTEIAPGKQPATYGICRRCFLQIELDAQRHEERRGDARGSQGT